MHPNPVLKKLGFTNHDRLAIIHADDVGMCQASLAAFSDLVEFGLVSSGAVMVPCPWFPATAAYARAHPGIDLGVHTTLTCEYQSYRWGPLSTRDPASGLLDKDGYFPRQNGPIWEKATPVAVQVELRSQLERALRAGITVTHIDTHMGTIANPKFMPAFIQLALENHLPTMIMRKDQAGYEALGMDPVTAGVAAQMIHQLEEMGQPLIDHLVGLSLSRPDDCLEHAKEELSKLPAGITHFILHPAMDTPELRAIAPDWPSRVANYRTFMLEELAGWVRQSGIQVIGYRALRDLIKE